MVFVELQHSALQVERLVICNFIHNKSTVVIETKPTLFRQLESGGNIICKLYHQHKCIPCNTIAVHILAQPTVLSSGISRGQYRHIVIGLYRPAAYQYSLLG